MVNTIFPLSNYTTGTDIVVKIVFSPVFKFGVTLFQPIRCHCKIKNRIINLLDR
jgi:hypothetical protein